MESLMKQQSDDRPGGSLPPQHAQDAGDGVDVSLIRWMLGLTPAERLDALQGFVDSVTSLRSSTDAAA
jgi:hypothetical protein